MTTPSRFVALLAAAMLVSLSLVAAGGYETSAAAAGSARHRKPSAPQPGLSLETVTPNAVALGLYRPAFPNDMSAVDEHDRAVGGHLPIVHWYALWGGWKSAFSRSDLDAVDQRGSLPMITWEPWAGRANDPAWTLRDAILSGAHDDYIDSWARGLADYGKPVLLRFAHEMHDQPYPWAMGVNGNAAVEYVTAWKHVRRIFARYATENVQWVWNPNTVGDATAAYYEPLYRSLYPGDDYVDWLGLDVYNTGPGLDWGAPYWRSFRDVLAEPYAAITAISDKPLILPEVGCAERGGSKADWIRDALTSQLPSQFPRVRALVWFDVVKEEPWALESSRQALEAWNAAARQAHRRID